MFLKGFDITVLGSDGGPLEGFTSSFLLKPSRTAYKDILLNKDNHSIISIDAGVGLGKITELINDEFNNQPNRLTNSLLSYYNESLTLIENQKYVKSISTFNLKKDKLSSIQTANKLFNSIQHFLITHAHLDHISSIGINSPSYGLNSGKSIYGISPTIKSIKENVFNDSIWPDLTSEFNGNFVTLKELNERTDSLIDINPIYKIKPFLINHGCTQMHHKQPYYSTAYLIQDKLADQYILFFGDVESDKASLNSLNLNSNLRIWKFISGLIIDKKLNSLIIECSTPNQPDHVPLYGHLTPSSLYEELTILNSVITDKIRSINDNKVPSDFKPLKGFNCLITHVKDIPCSDIDPKKIILDELNELEKINQLGIYFTLLLAGQTYTV